jgi:hypothetical protein
MKRPLTNGEKVLVTRIGEKLGGNEGAQLLADLDNATAVPATEDGSRNQFEIRGYDRPPYKGQHPFGVEGKMQDQGWRGTLHIAARGRERSAFRA